MPLVSFVPNVVHMPDLGDVVARNIRAERARRRWTQEVLAQRLGWSRPTVSAVEAGQRRVGVADLPALCRALNVQLPVLLMGADATDLEALGLPG